MNWIEKLLKDIDTVTADEIANILQKQNLDEPFNEEELESFKKYHSDSFINGYDPSATKLWSLCWSKHGKKILAKLEPEQLAVILLTNNLSAAPTNGRHARKTVLGFLRSMNEGQQLLAKLTHIQKAQVLLNYLVNSPPVTTSNAERIVIWTFCFTAEGKKCLNTLPTEQVTNILSKYNLDVSRNNGNRISRTALWSLCQDVHGLQLLAKLSSEQLVKVLLRHNLDAAPPNGTHAGITIIYLLYGGDNGRKLLAKLTPEQHAQILLKYNLDAAPTNGPLAGKSVLWMLCNSSSMRALLNKLPTQDLITIFEKSDLSGKQTNKSILTSLVGNSEGIDIVKKCARAFIAPNRNLSIELTNCKDQGIRQFFALLGIDLVKSSINAETERKQLEDFKKEFWRQFDNALNTLFNNMASYINYDLCYLLMFNVLNTQYPELGFLEPCLPRLIALRIPGAKIQSPLYKLAILATTSYTFESGRYFNKDQKHFLWSLVNKCLETQCTNDDCRLESQWIIDNKDLRDALVKSISQCDPFNQKTISSAIQNVVKSFRRSFFFGPGRRLADNPQDICNSIKELREARIKFFAPNEGPSYIHLDADPNNSNFNSADSSKRKRTPPQSPSAEKQSKETNAPPKKRPRT